MLLMTAPWVAPPKLGDRSLLCAQRLPYNRIWVALSSIREPYPCPPDVSASATMLLLKVIRFEVAARHSVRFDPRNANPAAERTSSVPQDNEQWSTITL